MGLEVTEDDAAAASGAECGNLLARLPGRGERTILLCAHLDTVDDGGVPVEPVVVDGGWENANAGILGADNKAAVAVILELARRCSVEGSPVGVELLFTVSEENALAGAKAFDVERPAVGVRLRLRPRDPDRRGHHRVADLLPHRRRLPRPRRPRRHPPRGRALGDPRRRPRDRRDAARAGSTSRRPPTSARSRAGRAPPTSSRSAAGCWPRRARSTPRGSRTSWPSSSTPSTTAPPTRSATSTSPPSGCSSATAPSRARPWSRPPRPRCARAATSRAGSSPAAARTPTRSRSPGCQCVNLANGTERNHEPTERVSVVALESMLDVAFALLDEAAAV